MFTRRLPVRSIYNIRDLGGLITKSGNVTNFGVFVRCAVPLDFDEADMDFLQSYGITSTLDLRSADEKDNWPSALEDEFRYFHEPLFNENVVVGFSDREEGSNLAREIDRTGWGYQYICMAEDSKDWAYDVLTIAAETKGGLLYHCMTGKDRTGILTCYLLSLAGVHKEDIIADYSVSNIYLDPVYRRIPPMGDGFYETPASAMREFISYMKKNYGGVTGFLKDAGIPEETLKKVRKKLIG